MCAWLFVSGLLAFGLGDYLDAHGVTILWAVAFWFVMFVIGMFAIGPFSGDTRSINCGTIKKVG